jgi:ADP-ribosylglycohydrolase
MIKMLDHDRIKGCIFGQALGDAVGAYTEFRSRASIAKDYPRIDMFDFPPSKPVSFMKRDTKCDWTDDTDHLILLMESLTENNGKVDVYNFAARLIRWRDEGFSELGDTKGEGLGSHMGSLLASADFRSAPLQCSYALWKQTRSASNGSLMRTAIMACRNVRRKQLLTDATLVGQVTHYDPACTDAIQLVTDIIHSVLCDKYPVLIDNKQYISLTKLHLDGTDMGHVRKCEQVAIWAYYHIDDDFQTIIKCIALQGGDADTNCAVAGAILGTRLGYSNLPQDWLAKLPHHDWLMKKIDAYLETIQLSAVA